MTTEEFFCGMVVLATMWMVTILGLALNLADLAQVQKTGVKWLHRAGCVMWGGIWLAHCLVLTHKHYYFGIVALILTILMVRIWKWAFKARPPTKKLLCFTI